MNTGDQQPAPETRSLQEQLHDEHAHTAPLKQPWYAEQKNIDAICTSIRIGLETFVLSLFK